MANKRWVTDGKKYDLLFTPFYDEICVLSFCQDKDDATCFWYVSKPMKIEHDCKFASDIEEAKQMFEEICYERIQNEIAFYEAILEKWEEW